MSEAKTLTLNETGIARLDDGTEAVNVGPIVAALAFLTEGRGDDRGTDEAGAPLADLLSLAFDVVKSIILDGRQAEYFRQVKLDFDAQSEAGGLISLSLAKQAQRRTGPNAALTKAGQELRARLLKLEEAASALFAELEALNAGKPARKPAKRRKPAEPAKPVKPVKPAKRRKPEPPARAKSEPKTSARAKAAPSKRGKPTKKRAKARHR